MSDAYRPSQWGQYQGDMQQLILIRPNITEIGLGSLDFAEDEDVGYFFDAILREEHVLTSRKTEHPVQTGAAVTDHVYNLPDRLVLDIGMSDAMDSFYPGQWEAGEWGSRSVNAYQTLRRLQKQRKLLNVTTKLNTYKNMVIMSDASFVEYKTSYGLRCTVALEELIFATVTEETESTRPQATDRTDKGPVQPLTPTPAEKSKADEKRYGASGSYGTTGASGDW